MRGRRGELQAQLMFCSLHKPDVVYNYEMIASKPHGESIMRLLRHVTLERMPYPSSDIRRGSGKYS